jgi:phosphohistidine phosphatase
MPSKRTLHIVRHAKSTWEFEEISDIDRPLKLRGIKAAYEMARRIKINCQMPDLLICSPANRALHTAIIFMRVFEYPFEKLIIDEGLYSKGMETVKKLIGEQNRNIKKLMIFGHNPDASDLATLYSNTPYIELPTCGTCRITFKSESWKDISKENMIESFLDYPKKE